MYTTTLLSTLATLLLFLTTPTVVLAAPTTKTTTTPLTTRSNTGDITYYEPGLGACGWTNSDSEHVVALSPAQFAADPDVCGKSISIQKDGKTASAQVVDKCPSCAAGSIDVSSTVFESLVDLSVGRTTVTWSYE
ncbi:RlpA-like double-psi beta-barrel-protein domain-containing protein-containing protein [Xylariomycetidae sp. FL2044]|nr:RlpA-like double-psi beta-barrel-protein domain-containing protein-containing protein [Xylariomycetidae sp. FL2044]